MQMEAAEKLYTINEYFALEKEAEEKHEYYNGEIIKMPGASFIHNRIAVNIMVALANKLRDTNYVVLNSDMKIHIQQLESFIYPDAVVIFEKPEFYAERNDTIINPLLVVEVASPSTTKYDRYTKFQYYKTLPSFKEYVLVEQSQPWVVASYKIAERTWKDTEATTLDGSVYLQSVDCIIELKDVYHRVQFNKTV